ncbi:MAG: SDR family oxidoreductase [bacterium]|nr:SDR family oxidoreductase [bacterium]
MLTGKTAFVSGGSGYIGAAICRTLSDYGARVVFSYHNNKEEADALAAELKDAQAVRMDLRDTAQITSTIESLNKDIGSFDILINNAAVSMAMPLAMLEEEDVDYVFDINIKGTLFLTKAVIRGMLRKKSGCIVTIGSIAGNRMLAVPLTYAMSKASLNGFTFALAAELKNFNIRVNSIIPGLLEGGVAAGVPDDLKAQFLKHCASGRPGKASEVAELTAFLASHKAAYINGQNIEINGGI